VDGAACAPRSYSDDIWTLAADRPGGISRTELRDLFSRSKKDREIDRALGALEDAGREGNSARRSRPFEGVRSCFRSRYRPLAHQTLQRCRG